METSRINDFGRVEFIYKSFMKTDFPRNELKPLASIRKMWEQHFYDCYQMENNGELVGYAFFVKQKAENQYHYLLDYFAIVPSFRDGGYGSAFLKQLSETIGDADCIIAEVEDPGKAGTDAEKETRQRRLSFYLRNGYIESGGKALVFGVPYRILCAGNKEIFEGKEISDIYPDFYRKTIPAPLYHKFFKLEK